MRSEDIWRGFSASAGMWDYAYAEFTKGHRFRLPLPTQRGENSPNVSLRFEPLKPQAAQVEHLAASISGGLLSFWRATAHKVLPTTKEM